MFGLSENQYVDVHTHCHSQDETVFTIRSLVKPGELELVSTLNEPLSVGLHPWFIEIGENEAVLDTVRKASHFDHVLAVGECGMDMLTKIPASVQEKVFLEQSKIAEEAGKPLLIHCVRAYSQLVALLKREKPSIPWIFHGFNHNKQIANELIRHGAYLSVGSDLLREHSNIRKSLRSIPMDRIFLETDEYQEPVNKLYTEASCILNLSVLQLKAQIFRNFRSCFCP